MTAVTPSTDPPREESRWHRLRTWSRVLGPVATLGLSATNLAGRLTGLRRTYRVHPRGLLHPIFVRTRTTDIRVLSQVLVEEHYGTLADTEEVGLVVDCGANVGYASVWFLSRFPRCTVVAVEPDPGNFALLERNLAPYGNRARAVRAGIWSGSAPLVIADAPYRDGGEWATQVRLARPDEAPHIQGIGIADLLEASGYDRISILKVDVEGAEAVLFSAGCEVWLDRVDVLAVELHDDTAFGPATAPFEAALEGRDFERTEIWDLVICRRPRPRG